MATRFSGLDIDNDGESDDLLSESDLNDLIVEGVTSAHVTEVAEPPKHHVPGLAGMMDHGEKKSQFKHWGALRHHHSHGATVDDAVVDVDTIGRRIDTATTVNPYLDALRSAGGDNTAELVPVPPIVTSRGTFAGRNADLRMIVDRDTGVIYNTALRTPTYSVAKRSAEPVEMAVQHRTIAALLHEAHDSLGVEGAPNVECHVVGGGAAVWWSSTVADFSQHVDGSVIDEVIANASRLGSRVSATGPRLHDALAMKVKIVARSSHSGQSIKFAMLPVVEACGNMAMVTVGGFDATISHNSLTGGRVKALRAMMTGARGKALDIYKTFAHLAHVAITARDLDRWLEDLYGKRKGDGTLTGPSAARIEQAKVVHSIGKGALPGTLLGVLAAVTDMETNRANKRPTSDHYSPTTTDTAARLTEARTNSALWGSGANRIAKTIRFCLTESGIAKGNQSLYSVYA